MNYEILSQSPLFRNLHIQEIEAVLSDVPFRVRRYGEGSMISQSGEEVNSIMIVISGKVKGEMVDETGRVIKIEDIPAPGALAAAFLFGNRNRFPVNVIALAETEILSVDRMDFLTLLRSNDTILLNFLNMISSRSQFLSEKIKFLNFKTIKGKLAHYILTKTGRGESSVVLDLTHNELADFFGVTRPSVSRAIGELEQSGYIKASGKHITITDRRGLSELTID
jgi:CRP-like cAMP-binding protein